MSTDVLTEQQIDRIISLALDEDISHGDVTSEALIPPDLSGKALIIVKEKGVLTGIEIAARVFRHIDPHLELDILVKDGTAVVPGDIAATVAGSFISILKGERVALNFLQRLSGIASLTAQYVAKIRGRHSKIYDTRKTTPGLRLLEKYAVRTGGGYNHRLHLADAVLIKDNHIAALRATGLSLKDVIMKAHQNAPQDITIEVEVTSAEEAREAADAGADIIMLDNMDTGAMKKAVDIVAGRSKLEASGNVTLENVREVAETGVDMISIGALTHSYRALDISLELDSPTLKLL